METCMIKNGIKRMPPALPPKAYCMICNFFKEDSKKRLDPRLEAQGVEWYIDLCDSCYEGLLEYKSSMKNWMNTKVRLLYTRYGIINKLESPHGLYISLIQYGELRDVKFDFHKDYGYVYGVLENYAFEQKPVSVEAWKPFSFQDGHTLKSVRKFMLSNKQTYYMV